MTGHDLPAASRPSASGPHRLVPLLAPRSIALVGASAKPGSVGKGMISSTVELSRGHRVYLVNPNYGEIDGRPCFPSLSSLPEEVEHVVLGVANARLEAQLDEAIACGAKAATIFGSCYLETDSAPPLLRRLAAKAAEAGLQICG